MAQNRSAAKRRRQKQRRSWLDSHILTRAHMRQLDEAIRMEYLIRQGIVQPPKRPGIFARIQRIFRGPVVAAEA